MANGYPDTTLAQIQKQVRRLTASPDEIQLSDANINQYIDTVYLYDFPAHLKLFDLTTVYTFYTEANEDRYFINIPDLVQTQDNVQDVYEGFGPPVFIAGTESYFYQDRSSFYRNFNLIQVSNNVGTGDNTAGDYTFTLAENLVKRYVNISAVDSNGDTQVMQDDGNGGMENAQGSGGSGTIDYASGVVTFSFPTIISSGTTINAQYVPTILGIPRAVLFYQNYFTVRPVPDKAYRVELRANQRPSTLLATTASQPDLKQWAQLIAYGAAVKISIDRQDMETVGNIMPFYQEQMSLANYRTANQLSKQRTNTIYSVAANTMGGYYYGGVNP